jgi:hypothetical protein
LTQIELVHRKDAVQNAMAPAEPPVCVDVIVKNPVSVVTVGKIIVATTKNLLSGNGGNVRSAVRGDGEVESIVVMLGKLGDD